MTGTATIPDAFRAPAEPDTTLASTDDLFTGLVRLIVQGPEIRNDYKKKAGSSDGAKTYDTTAT
ncbi:hypothetical protein ACQEU3_45940 [Spirillospora sp. CA-253888]